MRINTNTWNIIRYTIYTPIYDLLGVLLNNSRKFSFRYLDAKPGDKILIIGAGTGLDLNFMPRNLEITATDITPSMVYIIKNRAKRLNMKVDALVMDGQNLLFQDKSFDRIILHVVLAVMPDPYRCISEAERVLKDNGSILIYDKLLKTGRKPSFIRKVTNIFTNILFSNINRSIEDIIAHTKLEKTIDIPRELGIFRFIKLEKKS